MKILYNFASRSRPERFFKTYLSIRKHSIGTPYTILAKVDNDDERLDDYKQIADNSLVQNIQLCLGNSNSKIDAINRDIPATGWDILVNISDDFVFTQSGFDDVIIRDFLTFGNDSYIHYPDGFANSKLCTMSIIGKKYYSRDDYVYHPSYYSLWADNESMDVAKYRGCYRYNPIQLFEHEHYAAGKCSKDALYRRNDTYHSDKLIFEEREKHNFYL